MNKQHTTLIMIGTCILIYLVNLDSSIVNLALPNISKALAKPIIQTQWIITSYLIAAMIFFIVCGRLADHFGKKLIILFGCLCFLVSSTVLSFTNHLLIIIVARFIQGIGFAALLNLALLVNSELYPANKQGLVLGISITLTGLGQAMGPTLAGILLTYFSWHSLFIFNIPLSLLSFVLILFFYHAKHERPSNAPLIDISLFAIKSYQVILFVRFVFMFCWSTIIFYMPIYLQNFCHYSPFIAGCIILAMTFFLALASIYTGQLLDTFGAVKPMQLAMLCEIAAVIILFVAVWFNVLVLLIIGLIIFGIYCGAMLPSSIHAGIQSLPKKQVGMGMGIFFSGSFLFAALSVTVASHLAIIIPDLALRFYYLLLILLLITLVAMYILRYIKHK